jgi:hypothetical protein
MEDWVCRAGGTSADAGRGRLRASQAEREQAIETLKAAFVQGRLAKDEFDARVDQALTSKTRAELTAVTSDLPAEPAAAQPAAPSRPTAGRRVLTLASVVTAASWAGAGSGPAAVMLAWTLTLIWLGIAILTASVMLESRRHARATGTLPPPGRSGRTSLGY